MIQSAEDKVKEYCQCIHREIEHWKVINQNGCNDPFWSDGCNMNLTRNHIIYYQSKIHEACTENQLPLPDEYYLSIPPEVDNNYMANLKQKPRVERLRQLGRIMTGRIYQYDENQMSLFQNQITKPNDHHTTFRSSICGGWEMMRKERITDGLEL